MNRDGLRYISRKLDERRMTQQKRETLFGVRKSMAFVNMFQLHVLVRLIGVR
jgi:hypothetical protein